MTMIIFFRKTSVYPRKKTEEMLMKRYPLLQSQMGVFAECIKNPDSAGYNLPYVCRLPDKTEQMV